MKWAYALLGLAFIIVLGLAYILVERAYAPSEEDTQSASVIESETPMEFSFTSPAFEHNGRIPSQFTCDGAGTIPPLAIDGVPAGTKSLVLVMDDSDIPEEIKTERGIAKFDHFARYNIPADTTVIIDGNIPGAPALNSVGTDEYRAPCPPTEYEPAEHRYRFRLYALPEKLEFAEPPTLDELEATAKVQARAHIELIGRYARQ